MKSNELTTSRDTLSRKTACSSRQNSSTSRDSDGYTPERGRLLINLRPQAGAAAARLTLQSLRGTHFPDARYIQGALRIARAHICRMTLARADRKFPPWKRAGCPAPVCVLPHGLSLIRAGYIHIRIYANVPSCAVFILAVAEWFSCSIRALTRPDTQLDQIRVHDWIFFVRINETFLQEL